MAEVCFMEFGTDWKYIDEVNRILGRAGFLLRSQNQNDTVRFYSQESAVIVLKNYPGLPFTKTGIGLIASPEEIENCNCTVDDESGFSVTTDGYQVVNLVTEEHMTKLVNENFKISSKKDLHGIGLGMISGLMIPVNNRNIKKFWNKLGFEVTRKGEWSETAMSPSRRFSLIFSNQNRHALIVDTHVIFDVSTCLFLGGFHSKKSYHLPKSVSMPDINKVRAYECTFFGNSNSYSVEKFYPQALGNIDLLVRQRKQYLHIPEENLDTHYAEIEHNG
jgi:hypothetical protein